MLQDKKIDEKKAHEKICLLTHFCTTAANDEII